MRKLQVINNDGHVRGTKVLDVETGLDLSNCVTGMTLRFNVDEGFVNADVQFAGFSANNFCSAGFHVKHPKTGEKTAVKSMTLEDGTVLEF